MAHEIIGFGMPGAQFIIEFDKFKPIRKAGIFSASNL